MSDGVTVSDTTIERKIIMAIVIISSRKRSVVKPGTNKNGINSDKKVTVAVTTAPLTCIAPF